MRLASTAIVAAAALVGVAGGLGLYTFEHFNQMPYTAAQVGAQGSTGRAGRLRPGRGEAR